MPVGAAVSEPARGHRQCAGALRQRLCRDHHREPHLAQDRAPDAPVRARGLLLGRFRCPQAGNDRPPARPAAARHRRLPARGNFLARARRARPRARRLRRPPASIAAPVVVDAASGRRALAAALAVADSMARSRAVAAAAGLIGTPARLGCRAGPVQAGDRSGQAMSGQAGGASGTPPSGSARRRRSAMNASNSALSRALRSRSRYAMNSRCSSSSPRSVSSR